jgi:hypothetical protein
MIAPTPLQCDSPKVVTRKIVPKVDMPLEVLDESAPKGTPDRRQHSLRSGEVVQDDELRK